MNSCLPCEGRGASSPSDASLNCLDSEALNTFLVWVGIAPTNRIPTNSERRPHVELNRTKGPHRGAAAAYIFYSGIYLSKRDLFKQTS